MNENWHLVLADFGKAMKYNTDGTHDSPVEAKIDHEDYFIGTEQYISPEGLDSGKNSCQGYGVDLWSLGIIIWQLFSADNSTPFQGFNQEDSFKKIR